MNAILTRNFQRIVGWLVFVAICLSPILVWSVTVSSPQRYWRLDSLPPGQLLYVIAKLLGLFALFLFWSQCVLALARRTPMLSRLPTIDQRQHVRLGLATLVLILLHAGLFVAATSMRTDQFAWDLLLPNVGHGYYRTSVGLGAVALWLCVIAVYAGRRLAQGQRRWKMVHMLWPVVFGFAFVHAINIGTESRYGAMREVVYGLLVMLLVAGILRRVRMRRSNSGSRPDTTLATSA